MPKTRCLRAATLRQPIVLVPGRLARALTALAVGALTACGSATSAGLDGGPTGASQDAGAARDPNDATLGLGLSPTIEELCRVVVGCQPTTTLEACARSARPEVDEALRAGCLTQVNAANTCTLDQLSRACDDVTLPMRCAAPYAAYDACIAAHRPDAGAGESGPCCDVVGAGGHFCSTYPTASAAAAVCSAQNGSVVGACPPGEVLGRCTFGSAPAITTLDYYAPAPLSSAQYESLCTMNGGAWSVL